MYAQDKKLATWLFAVAAAVFLMALIGAITRLTESGLSIVEWKPIAGALPPLSAAHWQREFDLYKTSPQYQQVNAGMSLEDFKYIYFWEWLHRLWGRMIGLIYALPLAYFWARGRIPSEAKKPLLGILALGFLQGAMGWFMVKSGLVDAPAVSHYRLAAHLGLAFIIFCCLFRMGLLLSAPRDVGAEKASALRPWIKIVLGIAAVTMVWGAFVAGLRAGWVYNSFPLMGTHIWPSEIFAMKPLWHNFVENHATVQFIHRVLGVTTFLGVLALAIKGLSMETTPRIRKLLIALWCMVCVQLGLGIITLLTMVNIVVATLHQAGALVLLALFMGLLHEIPKRKKTI